MKKTTIITLILSILLIGITPALAFDSAGNYITQADGKATDVITGTIERDVYAMDYAARLQDAQVGRSFIGFGYEIELMNSTIGDSCRVASQSVSLMNMTVDNNITIATRLLEISGNTTSNAVYAAAQIIDLGGTTNEAALAAQTVTISGTVHGNVVVSAENVTVKSGAVIDGELKVYSGNEPVIEDGATVGNVDYDRIITQDEKEPTLGEKILDFVVDILYWSAVTLILGMLITVFASRQVEESAFNLRHRTAVLAITGIGTALLWPVISFLLLFAYVTVPITFMLLGLYALIISISIPFTAVVLARLVLPDLNKWLSALIGTLVLGVLSRLPFVGILVTIVCSVITFGAIAILLFYSMVKSFSQKENKWEVENRNLQ